eukprot:3971990-Alexandrium_andersonii.AAC.1
MPRCWGRRRVHQGTREHGRPVVGQLWSCIPLRVAIPYRATIKYYELCGFSACVVLCTRGFALAFPTLIGIGEEGLREDRGEREGWVCKGCSRRNAPVGQFCAPASGVNAGLARALQWLARVAKGFAR